MKIEDDEDVENPCFKGIVTIILLDAREGKEKKPFLSSQELGSEEKKKKHSAPYKPRRTSIQP